jgi:N-acetylneuraminic acid mutarotase
MIATIDISAQSKLKWTSLPALPDDKGWAGMFAGASNGSLFCMGGANFPDRLPWEGGKKKWYDGIFMLREGGKWVKLKERLNRPLAYGVTVSYKETIIIVGGGDDRRHSKDVYGYTWTGKVLQLTNYPSLPAALAFMSGALVNDLIIIAGGNEVPGGPAVRKCYALDLNNTDSGWFEIDPWPGPERILPVSAAYKGQFYLFSGETSGLSASNEKYAQILQDAYRLTLTKETGKWSGQWQKLSPMPKGIAAGASPLPVLKNGNMVLWGGVDALSRLHKDPSTFTAISQDVLLYDPEKDTWDYAGKEKSVTARVTLPVVYWNNNWVFISGETKPGIRTPAVTGLKIVK